MLYFTTSKDTNKENSLDCYEKIKQNNKPEDVSKCFILITVFLNENIKNDFEMRINFIPKSPLGSA